MSHINVLGKRGRSYISACFALRERLSRFYIDVIKLRSGAVHLFVFTGGWNLYCSVSKIKKKKYLYIQRSFLLFILPQSLLSHILVAFSSLLLFYGQAYN